MCFKCLGFYGLCVARFLTHSPSCAMTPSTRGLRDRISKRGRAFGGTSLGKNRWAEDDEELLDLSTCRGSPTIKTIQTSTNKSCL